MLVVPCTSSPMMRRCLCALAFSMAITGCGRLEYGSSGFDAGVGESLPGVDGSTDPRAPIDAAAQLQPDGGDVVGATEDSGLGPEPDAGPNVDPDAGPSGDPDAGSAPSDAGALDSGPSPVDSGTAAGCTPRCTRDELCSTPIGMCAAVGTCVARPDACLDVFAPVVGCDGMNYSNSCYAAQAGTSVLSSGAI